MEGFDRYERTICAVVLTFAGLLLSLQLVLIGYGQAFVSSSPFRKSLFFVVPDRTRIPFVELLFSPVGFGAAVIGFYASLAYFVWLHHRAAYGEFQH